MEITGILVTDVEGYAARFHVSCRTEHMILAKAEYGELVKHLTDEVAQQKKTYGRELAKPYVLESTLDMDSGKFRHRLLAYLR